MSTGGESRPPTKGELRRHLRAQRREIAGARDLEADAVAIAAVAQQALAEAMRTQATPDDAARPPTTSGVVLSYESLPWEPPTDALNASLQRAGHRVLVPITLPNMQLNWHDLADPDSTPLGLDSPHSADYAVIPALAVDQHGTRLGQGGGCYDRVLPMLPARSRVIALLHPGEISERALPSDPHDIPVTTVVTALGLRRVHRGDPTVPTTPT